MSENNEENGKYPVKEEDDLFSIYCDLHETAREWLLSGAGIRLDEVVDCIDVVENFQVEEEEKVMGYPLIRPHYEKIEETVSEMSRCYRSYMSKEKIGGVELKKMVDDIRELIGSMQRSMGKIQQATEEVEDIKERMALRETIKTMAHLKKLVKHFNDSFSRIKEIEWNSGYSRTHIHIKPKVNSTYRPIKSKLMDIEIRGETEVDITVGESSITAEMDGSLFLNFFAFGKIPNMHVDRLVIDGKEGVEIVGNNIKVKIEIEYGETKVNVIEGEGNHL